MVYLPALCCAYERERGFEQFEVLLVIYRLNAVDLYPFPRTWHTGRLERDHISP